MENNEKLRHEELFAVITANCLGGSQHSSTSEAVIKHIDKFEMDNINNYQVLCFLYYVDHRQTKFFDNLLKAHDLLTFSDDEILDFLQSHIGKLNAYGFIFSDKYNEQFFKNFPQLYENRETVKAFIVLSGYGESIAPKEKPTKDQIINKIRSKLSRDMPIDLPKAYASVVDESELSFFSMPYSMYIGYRDIFMKNRAKHLIENYPLYLLLTYEFATPDTDFYHEYHNNWAKQVMKDIDQEKATIDTIKRTIKLGTKYCIDAERNMILYNTSNYKFSMSSIYYGRMTHNNIPGFIDMLHTICTNRLLKYVFEACKTEIKDAILEIQKSTLLFASDPVDVTKHLGINEQYSTLFADMFKILSYDSSYGYFNACHKPNIDNQCNTILNKIK